MARFSQEDSLSDLQNFIKKIYGLNDDRFFSLSNLMSNQERFTMRVLKGIRKNDKKKLKSNLLIALSWLLAISNRLHIIAEEAVWLRFPYACSYCGASPCTCADFKPKKRKRIKENISLKPKNLSEMQKMFNKIYPQKSRTLFESGIHLAEETGETSEIIHLFLGTHEEKKFQEIKNEIADWISCFFGVANSAKIDIAKELTKMYSHNCHVCHKLPCDCDFKYIGDYSS